VEHEPTDPPVPGQSIAELLESVFPALSSPDRARLLELTHMLELAAGTTMFIEGAEGDQLLFLLGGTVAVETADGLVRLRPGSVVGERAPLARRPRDATVRAITDVVVLELYARDLDRLPAPVRDVLHAKVI
jgi:CRP-like cAMP-binding protein